ncbi:hypothetical protein GCM10022378_05300 [Salinicoccus jeotgali]|uniref:DUF697 domain-containing protein n=1 Tax=Salinicoccus jeotgali TaxID=381634 RepID=A0ABP7EFB1_9STAP
MSEMMTNDVEEKRRKARKMVDRKAMYSSVAAILPIPFLDIGTDVKLMRDIRSGVEEIFELNHRQVNEMSDDLMNRAAVMATSMGSEFLGGKARGILFKTFGKKSGKTRFSFLTILSKIIGAAISYMLMKKLGYEYIERCAKVS